MTSISDDRGFTLVELLVALVLSAILLLTIGALWCGLESKATRLTDRLVWTLQAKVAGTRLERDLGAVCAADASGQEEPTVFLEARADRIVFLVRPGGQPTAELIAWDLSDGRLMRRRGLSEGITSRAPVGGWVFNDNKTILESVVPVARFTFFAGSRQLVSPLSPDDLRLVDRVQLEAADAAQETGQLTPGQQAGQQLLLLCDASIGR